MDRKKGPVGRIGCPQVWFKSFVGIRKGGGGSEWKSERGNVEGRKQKGKNLKERKKEATAAFGKD